MEPVDNNKVNWDRLLPRIKLKKVIPVIGLGVYRVKIESEGKKDCALYDYLAEKLLSECGATLNPKENHKFAKACFEFLKKNDNDYIELSEYLRELLKGIQLISNSSLRKLARIKSFDVFMNTTYDDFLVDTIQETRNIPTEVLHYTLDEKNLSKVDGRLADSLKKSLCTLVYNIFGNINTCTSPAYTERDILETIVEFQKDLLERDNDFLSSKLKGSSLLFFCCGFDDWLFRFFIRTIANESYEFTNKNQTYKLIEDDFFTKVRDPFSELPLFLKNYKAEVIHSSECKSFVDKLFEEIKQKYPDEIIPFSDFSGTTFLSFEGTDRSAAIRLARTLKKHGFNVWLDKLKIKPGDDIDEVIIKAIDNCPVFIPLISRNSERLEDERKELKYHIQEWEWGFKNMKSGNKRVTIIPVRIDETNWMYEKFNRLAFLKIPNGKGPQEEKLIERLKEILKRKND